MCMDAAYHLPKDIYEGLKKGRETEESPVGCIVLDQIIKNAEIADAEDRPYCQDTGMTGTTTCLGVNIEWGATHIAGLPVAVTIMCHAARHKHVVL